MTGTVSAVSPDQQYKNSLSEAKAVTPFTEFGDQISLRDGSTSFRNVDIEVPGNGPTIRIIRTTGVQDGLGREFSSGNHMSAWELAIPRIKTITANDSSFDRGSTMDPTSPLGWQVNAPDKDARCTHFREPGDVTYGGRSVEFLAADWWAGYQLVDDNGADHKLLQRTAGMPYPQYKIGTSDNWVVDCLPSTANGEPGEAFLAIAPDGTKYWFNYLSYTGYDGMAKAFPDMPPKGYTLVFTLFRRAASMLVTRVEDRFGNWLTYGYDAGKLTTITASDGRLVTLNHGGAGGISSITVGTGALARTWNYTYDAEGLAEVILPDGAKWRYDGEFGIDFFSSYSFYGCDQLNPNPPIGIRQATIYTPSGAKATYSFEKKVFGRSYVQKHCEGFSIYGETEYAANPKLYTGLALTTKFVSGPGLPDQQWTYTYSPPNGSYAEDCASGCASQVWTDVVDPGSERVRSYFSNRPDQTENKLVREESYSASGVLKRSIDYTYATAQWNGANPFPWPLMIGWTGENRNNFEADGRWTPITSTTITQDGATFSQNNTSFDGFARAIDTVRSSSLGFTRSERVAYSDNPTRWVMGQVASTTCIAPASCAGMVMSQTDYDASFALPLRTYSFGKLQQTLAYNADGTIDTVKDGNDHVTRLSNWKRGIPQTVQYPPTPEAPAGALLSVEVNDLGEVTRVTDENGFATTYSYDLMSRLASISYPAGDGVAWSPTTQVFEAVLDPEYGLPAGHWRQTISTGNARKMTYYDALWRPALTWEYDYADAAGTQRFQRFTYDHDGRVTFASYPHTASSPSTGTWTEYDALGRVTSVSQDSEQGVLSTRTEYLAGAQVRVTSPRQYSTLSGFQMFDNPVYDKPVWIQHPEGAFTDIARDVFGKPMTLTRRNANSTERVDRQYVYQADQLLCKSIEPETGISIFGYDGAGNLVRSAAGLGGLTSLQSCNQQEAWASASVVNRTYDARNRLKTLVFPVPQGGGVGNGDQVWNYTPDGLPQSITTQNDTTQAINTYQYNKRRLLTSETLEQPGRYQWSMGYGYDANGSLALLTYPELFSVDYAPDALGQPTRAGTYATNVRYYPNGAVKQFTYGNGVVHLMTQNDRQLPGQVTDGAVLNNVYSYDKNGNVAQILDGVVANTDRQMGYDGLDRLTSTSSLAFGGTGQAQFTYDTLDNLKSSRLPGVRDNIYWYDLKNRLTSIRTPTDGTVDGFDYDDQGNLKDKSGQLFKFDFGNRLREAVGKETYRYDGHGRRIQATDPILGNAGDLLSFYGNDGVLRYQDDQRRSTRFHYVTLAGSLVAKVKSVLAPAAPVLTAPSYSPSGSYSITWTQISGATRYELQESTNGGAWQGVYSSAATSYGVSGKAGGNYGYQIRACNAGACSGWSGQANVAVELPPSVSPSISAPAQAPNGNYTVSWTSVSGLSRYVLEENSNGAGWSTVQDGAGLARSYSGKAAGNHAYRVAACNPAGCGPASSTVTVAVYYAPASAPGISSPGSSSSGSYTVTWTSVAGANAYQFEESANGGAWTLLQDSSATSAGIGGRGTGSYAYRVRGCNGAGCGPYSGTTTTSVLLPPSGAPSISVPGSSGNGSYTVSWSGVGGASTYQLEEQVNGGGWTLILNAAQTSLGIGGKGDGSYGYRARGCNASGCATWSGTATVVVSLPPPIPAMPASLDGSVEYDNSVRPPAKETNLWWPSVSGATYYEVAVGASPGAPVYSGPYNSYTDWIKQTRSFWVRACNAAGCSAWKGPKTL
ncbi:RHS repeat protein [Lysobacter sp. S4-A87]|uniref:RHS repeat protein n=1 Tax=Lysobacter sp. S4-A87 TaxID=2925843 RepID=UPI001F52C8C2|nr:RHS repeat protein [Lysobacter sp. S4-A87]UNK49278.1 RHS repeat protein [Lysobacter sp. S4-A87]